MAITVGSPVVGLTSYGPAPGAPTPLTGIEQVEAELQSLASTRGVPVPPLQVPLQMQLPMGGQRTMLSQTQQLGQTPQRSAVHMANLAASAASSTAGFASAYSQALSQKSQAGY